MTLARALAAPAPSWERSADVLVVGSGVAGLTVALTAAQAGKVLVLTKANRDAGSTTWAQGGIAAAIALADTPEQHLDDTLVAGAGLCSEQAVRLLVEEGPARLAQLISRGMKLDVDAHGALALTREGGHGRARIVHAQGDATGAEVQRALDVAVDAAGTLEVVEQAFVLDVLKDADGRVAGALCSIKQSDGTESVGVVFARVIVLACGGVGQIYASTTNPPVATGDGVAVAFRAGARIADMEFVQFHPTVLWQGSDARGQQLLVSEAVRGEGAVLVDASGARVMQGVHPQADLAPRDVVAKAMSIRMASSGVDHLYLDATGLGEATLTHRFPTIVTRCRKLGIDPATTPIPVAPGEHFLCGGVWTDRSGRTSIPGLYAVGETACTGVHGANRLASNSLLEGLVFGERVGSRLVLDLPRPGTPVERSPATLIRGSTTTAIGSLMSRHGAVRRDAEGLEITAGELAQMNAGDAANPTRADWEATNIHAIATALVEAAQVRRESRGCHWRVDFPETGEAYAHRTTLRLTDDGIETHPVGLEDTP